MKPIYKACGKDDLRPSQQYFQVKGGYVRATNGSIMLKMPANELFGSVHIDPIIGENEELYFNGKEWMNAKFHTTKMIFRDGLYFKTDKGVSILAKTAEQFADIGRFPDCDAVIPEAAKPLASINRIGLDFILLSELCAGFGSVNPRQFTCYFYGTDRCIIVKHPDSQGFGLLMPNDVEKYALHPFLPDPIEELMN